MAEKTLLVNLGFEKFYEKTNIKGVAPTAPPLSLACLAGSLVRGGFQAKVFDFNIYEDADFVKVVEEFAPDYVGVTFVTPLIQEANRVAQLAKSVNPDVVVMAGGPHASSFPESTLQETVFDLVAIGEGDFTICEILEGKDCSEIQGIAYKDNGAIQVNPRKPFIKDLDVLAPPNYDVFELDKYQISPAIARGNPVAWVETSRGCVYDCVFCNKNCFGRTFRVKSPQRVVEDFQRVIDQGFKEIYLADDGFTTNMTRAKKVGDLLIEKNIKIDWCTLNGIRADRVDLELLKKMKQAGCYRIYLGVESGNQGVLDRIKKGTKLEYLENAVAWGKQAGLEVVGYFMLGLPGDTEETMQQTIDFAKKLDLDLAKASVTIPLPATEMFNDLDAEKLIKTYDWTKYKFHSVPSSIYDHQTLPWPVIEKYYKRFYRQVYLRPSVIIKKLAKSLKNKTLFSDAKLALSIKWF
ncbi:MAG: B12-binding domain-containing radical SAM protein [Anaerohalosphaeraceae bacterium]